MASRSKKPNDGQSMHQFQSVFDRPGQWPHSQSCSHLKEDRQESFQKKLIELTETLLHVNDGDHGASRRRDETDATDSATWTYAQNTAALGTRGYLVSWSLLGSNYKNIDMEATINALCSCLSLRDPQARSTQHRLVAPQNTGFPAIRAKAQAVVAICIIID